ncbi:Cation/H(+) antiporter 19 [Asimina triloba]
MGDPTTPVLNDQAFAILVLMALFTTFITTPLVTVVYKPARRVPAYKHRTVQRKNPESELRILGCFHSSRSIPTLINLIESSRGTRRRGITVYAMHLMELSERSSAISMVHKARRNGLPFWNKTSDAASDRIVIAFEAYQQLSHVSIRPMTAISHLSSIHEDICTSAQQKRAALILLPFHKHQHFDGSMVSLSHAFRHVNLRVLRQAPCSVGILIDRGLGGTTQIYSSDVSLTAVVLFFGGRDDLEALAYGCRIAEHPGMQVSVVRFVARAGTSLMGGSGESVAVGMEANESAGDDECVAELRSKINASSSSMTLEEKVVESTEEVVEAVKSMNRCNLFLVGRMPPVASLARERTDCPELGPVGCLLASAEISTTASVLVLQQYDPAANVSPLMEEVAEMQEEMPDTPARAVTND